MKRQFCLNWLYWLDEFHCCSVFSNQQWSAEQHSILFARFSQGYSYMRKYVQCFCTDFSSCFVCYCPANDLHQHRPEADAFHSIPNILDLLGSPEWHFLKQHWKVWQWWNISFTSHYSEQWMHQVHVDSTGFWCWCIYSELLRFWTSSIIWYSRN
jgi:hypothetical protein